MGTSGSLPKRELLHMKRSIVGGEMYATSGVSTISLPSLPREAGRSKSEERRIQLLRETDAILDRLEELNLEDKTGVSALDQVLINVLRSLDLTDNEIFKSTPSQLIERVWKFQEALVRIPKHERKVERPLKAPKPVVTGPRKRVLSEEAKASKREKIRAAWDRRWKASLATGTPVRSLGRGFLDDSATSFERLAQQA